MQFDDPQILFSCWCFEQTMALEWAPVENSRVPNRLAHPPAFHCQQQESQLREPHSRRTSLEWWAGVSDSLAFDAFRH